MNDQHKISDAIAFLVLTTDIMVSMAQAPDITTKESESFETISVRINDLLDDLMRLVPEPITFGQRQALDYIRDNSTDFDKAKMCSRMIQDLDDGIEVDFPVEEVERTYYDKLSADSVSSIWRKFAPKKLD